MSNHIDITFDFRSDTKKTKDPDTYSATLRNYHKLLWSKPLPSGVVFELEYTTSPPYYLHHQSKMGKFVLSSDAVIPSFTRESRCSKVIKKMPVKELNTFNSIGYTMGGMMIWPANRIKGKMTINGARGFHPRIKDRFDLTVECIRRHYRNECSPLREVLNRYADFFRLFGDFRGYVEFFLLQDIVTEDCSAVKFSMPFDEQFIVWPFPASIEDYKAYQRLAVEFIQARNQRILESG